MFRRWLLALLVACLAAPAMAMPLHCLTPAPSQTHTPTGHDAAAPHHGHAPAKPSPRGADHGTPAAMAGSCIGCIVPAGEQAIIEHQQHVAARPALPSGATLPARPVTGPDTPPPRG